MPGHDPSSFLNAWGSLSPYLPKAAFGLGMIVLVAAGVSYVFARIYAAPGKRARTETPTDYGLPFEPIAFRSHGKLLHGWFIPPCDRMPLWPAVITVHGWSFDAGQTLPLARQLHDAGFAILAFDARGHGASEGDGPITILKFAEDVLAALCYLRGRPVVDRARIGVVGYSIGGASAILAASMDDRLRALVSVAAFADPLSLTRRHMKRARIPRWPFLVIARRFLESWLDTGMAEVAPKNRIGRVAVPVLLVHGASDRFVPPSDMDVIFREANQQNTRRWLVPDRRHSDVHLDHEFGPRVVDFLQGAIG